MATSQAALPPGLLASDLDGTLAVGGRISEGNRRAAERLRAAGIPVLVITGRNLRSLEKIPGLWDIADSILFSSGSGLLDGREEPAEERYRLSVDEVLRIAAILDDFGEDYCVLDPIPDSHRFFWCRHRLPAGNPDFDSRMAVYSEWASPWTGRITAGACQILVIRPAGAALDPRLEKALSPWSVFHSSSPLDHRSMWLEVFPSGVNKGQALSDWCATRGLTPERVMTLGNDFNDWSMLDWSAYPRVVGNAPPALLNRFPCVPSADRDGFAAAVDEAIRLFG